MSAPKFYQHFFDSSLADVEKRRKKTIIQAVFALMKGAKATLTDIGRHLAGSAQVKHKIKKIDRLFSNERCYQELPHIYAHLTHLVTRHLPKCVIAVDWSRYHDESYSQLRASLVYQGRALPIMSQVVEKKREANHSVHVQFLAQLKAAIGPDKDVIILTDAGFKTPWFKEVDKLGWGYIGRERNGTRFLLSDADGWESVHDYKNKRPKKATSLGKGLLGKHTPSRCQSHFHLYYQKPKRQNHQRYKNDAQRRCSQGNTECWLLVTNQETLTSTEVANLYRCRMQIEANFRDEKSTRYGLSFSLSKSKGVVRLSILCLLTVLALILLWLYGFYLEITEQHRHYQANTEKTRRILSFQALARNVIRQSGLKAPPFCWFNKLFLIISSRYLAVVYLALQ